MDRIPKLRPEKPPTDGAGLSPAERRLRRQLAIQELECRRLELRARQAEQALAEFERSSIWRWSRPLREALIALRGARRRLGFRLVGTRTGHWFYARVGALSRPSAAQAVADKSLFKADAEQRFVAFMEQQLRLSLPSADRPRVSIVLVFFNQAELSLDCLRSIVANCRLPAEVIIVDNASSDRTGELLGRLDGARLIRNDGNKGFVEAVNQAAGVARGDHLLLLNNDAELMPGAIEAALETLESDPRHGAVGGRIVLLDGSLQEAGSIIWRDGSCLGYGRGSDPEQPEFMFRREVDYCSGAFLLTPRVLFEQLGGFDLAYAPAYYEESDYCTRLRLAGYWVIYEPAAVIRHFEFASSGGFSGASELQRRHREVFVQRHPDFLSGQLAPDPAAALRARSASGRRRLLLIDDRVPHVYLGAGYPRCSDLVHTLVGLGFELTLYPLNAPDDDWREVWRSLPREVEVMLGHGIVGLASFVRQRRDFYDQVIISRPHNMKLVRAALGDDLDRFGRAGLVYDAEAVIAPREVARRRLLGEPVEDSVAQAMLAKELVLADGVDRIVTVSTAEAELFRAAGHRRIDVLGHGVEPAPTSCPFEERQGFLFIGALRNDGSPNVDSLLWFIEQVLPGLVEALGADCVLYVVGEPSAPSLKTIDSEHVHFLGSIDSLDLPLSISRVFVAPTRFAAGIPHKVHAAAAGGLPVVATGLLARQLGWQHEQELLVADSAEACLAECLRLYRDERLWQSLRESALGALARDCSREAFRSRTEAIFGRGDQAS